MGVADKSFSVVNWVQRYAETQIEDGESGHLRICVPDKWILTLTEELIRLFPPKTSKDLENLYLARDTENIKRVLRGSSLHGVYLDFEEKINGNSRGFIGDPQRVLVAHTLKSGLEFLRFGNGRVAIRMAGNWLGDIKSDDWETVVTKLSTPQQEHDDHEQE